MSTPGRDVLRIRRWHNEVLIPYEHPDVRDLQDRIDHALESSLARVLSAVLTGAVRDDGSIVFVRRLDVDWTIDAAWDTAGIARHCALAVAREVVGELSSPSSDNVVRFSSRADYVAAYVASRATGAAATAWFYASFDGWSVLPASAAIRSALCQEPDVGLLAIRALPRTTLALVAAALDDEDAAEIVRRIADSSLPTSDTLRSTVDACLAGHPPLWLLDRPALGVWILAQTTAPSTAAGVRQAAAVLSALHRAADRRGIPLDDETLRMLREDRRALSALAAATAAGVPAIVDQIAAAILAPAGSPADGVRTHASTPFGGVFLLLDDLAELPWDTIAGTRAALGTASAVSIIRLAVLGRALCSDDWGRLFDDPFWRDRFGIPGAVTLDAVASWMNEADAEMLSAASARLLRRFARRLPGFAASGDAHLRQNFLAVAAAVDFEADRFLVTLSRPPLDLILKVAGVNRGVRRWPWLDERPFVLFSEDL